MPNSTKEVLNMYSVKTNSYIKFQVNISKYGRGMSGKLNFTPFCKSKSNATKSNLICIMSRQTHIPKTKLISQTMTDKYPKN